METFTDPRARALGRRIIGRRRELNLTQDALAETSTISQGAISRIERGTTMPSLETLQRLRRALAVSDSEWLMWLDLFSPQNNGSGDAA